MPIDRATLIKLAGFGGVTAVALAANQLNLGEHAAGLLGAVGALVGEGARAVWGHLGVNLIEKTAEHPGGEERARGAQNRDLHRLMGEAIARILEREAEGTLGGKFGGDYLKHAAEAFRGPEWMTVDLTGSGAAVGEPATPKYFTGDAESIKHAPMLELAEWFALVEKVAGPATFAEYDQALNSAAAKLREHFAFELWEATKHAWKTGDLAWPALVLRLLSLILGDAGDAARNSAATAGQLIELRQEIKTLSDAVGKAAAGATARISPNQLLPNKEMLAAIHAYQDDLRSKLARIDEHILEIGEEVRGGLAKVLERVAEVQAALRKSRFGIALLLSLLFITLLSVAFYSWHARSDIGDVRNILVHVIQQTQNTPSDHSPESQKQLLHASVYKIASESGIDPDTVNKRLDGFIAEIAANRAASLRDQALAAFAKDDNIRTEQLAEDAATNILNGPGSDEFKRPLVRDMHMLASYAAANQDRWSQAATYSRLALAYAKADTESAIYARVGLSLGNALDMQERDNEALDAMVQLKAVIGGQIGTLGDDGADFLNALARLQLLGYRFAESEATLKESLRLFGSARISHPSPQTVYAYALLSGVLGRLDKEREADEALKQANEIIASARARGQKIEADIYEGYEELAVSDAYQEEIKQNLEDTRAENAKHRNWAARRETLITLLSASIAAAEVAIRTSTILVRVAIVGRVLLGSSLICICYCVWWILRREPRKPQRPQEPQEAALSPDSEVRRQLLKRQLQTFEHYVQAHGEYLRDLQRYRDRTGRLLKVGISMLAAASLSVAIGSGSDWLENKISGLPWTSSRLITEARGDADFAEKAFGPFSNQHLDSLANLADYLDGSPNHSPQDESEAEAVYKLAISLRQLDAKSGGGELSKLKLPELMEKLAGVLKKEGKNKESDDWLRRAHDLRRLPPFAGK